MAHAAASPSAGCGGNASPTGERALTVTVNGVKRTFKVKVEGPYVATAPRALVFGFHGLGGSSSAKLAGRMAAIPSAATAAVFVDPDGIAFENAGVGWNQRCEGYDLAFFDEMVRVVEAEYCIDTKRRFALGFSWGADFVNALACCRGDVLRAVAAESGDEVDYNGSCPGSVRPAFRISYGGADNAYLPAQFTAAVDFYRAAHGCSAQSDPVSPSPCVSYRGCAKSVLECRYPSLGHTEPPNAAEDMWAWFASFP